MNLSNLSKVQKQYIILTIMAVVTGIAVLQNLVIGPLRERAASAQEQFHELDRQVSRGEAILNRDQVNRTELAEFSQDILATREQFLPPPGGRYLWALGEVSDIAHQLNLYVNVREHPAPRHQIARGDEQVPKSEASMWIPYAVDVGFQASYQDLITFLQQIHASNPYTSLASLTIQSVPDSPENHRIRLILEWPSLRYADDTHLFTEYAIGAEQ